MTKSYPQELKDFIQEHINTLHPRSVAHHINKYHTKEYDIIIKHTKFLPNKISLGERLFCIINDVHDIIKCKNCNNVFVKFICYSRGYREFCSKHCAQINKQTLWKKKNTCLKKYGVENPFQSDEIKNKIKTIMIKKYGVENCSQSDHIKDIKRIKTRKTCLDKYGVENVFQSEYTKSKIKQSYINIYGVDHPMKNSICRNRMLQTKRELFEGDYTIGCNRRCVPAIGKNEITLINEVERVEKISIIRQYPVCGYVVDGYCVETNTVYEVDEMWHRSSQEQINKDIKREQIITKHLLCEFIRIKDETH